MIQLANNDAERLVRLLDLMLSDVPRTTKPAQADRHRQLKQINKKLKSKLCYTK